jgi:hypothetical protein
MGMSRKSENSREVREGMSKEREVDVENFVIKILIFPLSYIDA